MNSRLGMLCLVIVLLVGWGSAAVGQDMPPTVRVLVVDETKTFTSTIKVAGIVGALRQMGVFEVAVRLADATSAYADPLAGAAPDPGAEPFDLILILPRSLDRETGVDVWLVSGGLSDVSPFVRGGVELISQVVDQVFAGSGRTIDVSEDLWPGLLWTAYVSRGWMR